MALEDLTGPNKYIANLVPANPPATDPASQGSDHIQGIKNVLQNSFPGMSGPYSFNGGLTLGHGQINFNNNVAGSIEFVNRNVAASGFKWYNGAGGTAPTMELSSTNELTANAMLVNLAQKIAANALTRKDYVDGVSQLNNNGYMKFPGGLILQWGIGQATTTAANTPVAVAGNFPTAFPNALLALMGTPNMESETGQILAVNKGAPSNTQWSFRAVSSEAGIAFYFTYLAIGY